MLYYDANGFHATQNETKTRYEITEEKVNELFNDLNSRDQSNDIWRFVPDENGKPIIIEIKIDYTIIYRKRRERECFPIINRGNAWYRTLTEEQTLELNTWYQAWLDAPNTLIEPKKPGWL